MLIRRTIPIILERSEPLLKTVDAFNHYQKSISDSCFNGGDPLRAVSLHKEVYRAVDSVLCSQLRCTAIRLVAGAYSAAKAAKRVAKCPFIFRRKQALFLIGKRGRDASFTKEGKLSIWTIGGRQKIGFRIPAAFVADFEQAVTKDSLSIGADGKGLLCLTLQVEEPAGATPIGIDLGIRNVLVASTDEQTVVVSGGKLSQKRKRIRKTRSRIQAKKSSKKELGKDSRSVRRALKSLSRKQRHSTQTFCKEVAAKLCQWAPSGSVLVFEDLRIERVSKKEQVRKGTRRKLNLFCYDQMIQSVRNRAERDGLAIAFVDPAYTSQTCSSCRSPGNRMGSRFSCLSCGYHDCADRNASLNILFRYAVLRGGGPQSAGPEARALATGKLPALAGSS
jgi:putative transposase